MSYIAPWLSSAFGQRATYMGVLFVLWERKNRATVTGSRDFPHGGFVMASLALFLFGGVFYGIMYLLPQFAQAITGYDPITVGQLFLPSTLVLAILVPIVGMASFPPPTLSRGIASLPSHLLGFGSGAINFALQLGGAFGTAALVTLMDRRTMFHSSHLTRDTPGSTEPARQKAAQPLRPL